MWGTPVNVIRDRSVNRFIPTHVGNAFDTVTLVPSTPVHPHACGERLASWSLIDFSGGSSPRMWGTLLGNVLGRKELRFIPTHVGNTVLISLRPLDPSVHPHACGEHMATLVADDSVTGSSPRMWGTRISYGHPSLHLRFIPTHVGNTLSP